MGQSQILGYDYGKAIPVSWGSARITGGHWGSVVRQSRDIGLPKLYEQYESRNIVRNFVAVAQGEPRATQENAGNYDEFLYKAMEAGACYLSDPQAERLRESYARIRHIILAAQQPDGYLVTQAISEGLEHFSEHTHHEMYNAGHMVQAGIAELRTTGDSTIFDATRRYVDLLVETYTSRQKRMAQFRGCFKWPDHPNLEMALVQLYRETGESKYLEFCKQILDFSEYSTRTQMMHHAVQEILHATGGADYYLATGDREVWDATERLWHDLLKKTYVTGAYGSVTKGPMSEAIGKDFQLTNHGAYTETCASVSMVFWSWRMFLASGQAHYIDTLERALYNGVQAGIARNGYEYFYENPLEYRAVSLEGSVAVDEDALDSRRPDRGGGARAEFHSCSCCPPNVQRLLASLHQYVYAAENDNIWVNLFMESELHQRIDRAELTLRQRTAYPWDGTVRLEMGLDRDADFALHLRVPGWCDATGCTVNGEQIEGESSPEGYLSVRRTWHNGDVVELVLEMEVRLLAFHPKNVANYGKVAITRGPLIYCLEGIDNPEIDLFGVVLPTRGDWTTRFESKLLGGITVLEGAALVRDDADWHDQPFQVWDRCPAHSLEPVSVRAIPYYTWANRGKSSMVTAFPWVDE